MALTVYGNPFSPFVARVLLAATIKGFRYRVVTPSDGGATIPEVLKLNPFGKVPVLVDGRTRLFESDVIVEYLDAKSKRAPLVPKAAKAMAAVRLTGAIAAEYVQPPAVKLLRYWFIRTDDPAARAKMQADLGRGLDALEKFMTKSKYAGGARLSVADVQVIPTLFMATHIAPKLGIADPLATRAKLRRYWTTIQADKLLHPVLAMMSAWFQETVTRRG